MIENEEQFMRIAKKKFQLECYVAQESNPNLSISLQTVVTDESNQIQQLQKQMDEYDAEHNPDRVGKWMPLYSGKRFWPQDPRVKDIDIVDIAHGLSVVNRFNGHTILPYSVAQHSVLVASLCPDHLKVFGLLHDAGEAYLGDIITPLKRLFREFYEGLEHGVMEVVAEKFDFFNQVNDDEAKAQVKQRDYQVLDAEVKELTTTQMINGAIPFAAPDNFEIGRCWEPYESEQRFIQAWRQYAA